MSYATAAPGQMASATSAVPVCQNCQTSTTPLWRRDEAGSVLCNACGLFLKLHGRPRPISLKSDVIKSRNRVRVPPQPGQPSEKKKKAPNQNGELPPSRSDTPSALQNYQQASNIAPQAMFDGATLEAAVQNSFASPFMTQSASFLPPRNRSPSPSMLTGGAFDMNQAYQALQTRVSELEVINDLFRGRVAELENSEKEARKLLDESKAREEELRTTLNALEQSTNPDIEDSGERRAKRARKDDGPAEATTPSKGRGRKGAMTRDGD